MTYCLSTDFTNGAVTRVLLLFDRPSYLPTFRNYFSVFLIFLFVPGVLCCQHFSGPSRVSDYFRPVERGLRLDGDLERLWWKLFIHVNSDLSEISQEQLWLLDTSASRGRQSVAKMMTSFAFSCLSHHRGSIGDAETPRFPCCQRSHGTPGSKSVARRRAHRSTPTRSQAGYLVGKYGVQASATDLKALPLGPTPPPGNSTLGSSVPHSPPRSESKRPVERPSFSDTGHSARLEKKGSVQQSLVNQPVYSEHVPVTPGPGKTRYPSNDRCPVSPTSLGIPGAPTTPGAPVTPGSPVTPGALVRPVYTGQKAQKEKADQCLDRSELPVLISPVRLVQLEHNVHEPLGNMPTLQIEHSSEHSQAFQDLTNSDSPVPGNIGCTGYTRSDQALSVTPAALVTPGDPSLGTLFQIGPLGLGPIPPDSTLGIWLVSLGFRLRPLT